MAALLEDTAHDLHSVPATHANPAAPPLMLEDDYVNDNDHGRVHVMDIIGDAADSDRDQLVPNEESDSERLNRLYPNSFHTSDIKHVVDNLLGETLAEMQVYLGAHLSFHAMITMTSFDLFFFKRRPAILLELITCY